MNKKFNSFSVPLGLLDYVNPILYTVTMITIIRNMYSIICEPYNGILLTGVVISIFFGFIIPTGKVLVGLGVIKFVMPVALVLSVNSGIFLTGSMLMGNVFKLNPVVLVIIMAFVILLLVMQYRKNKKLNTIAVLIGAVGYLMLYISLITMSIRNGIILPIVLYGLAIMLFVMLIGIGIKADLKNPKIHWVIEISNVTCQLFVTIATLVLFGII
ncbi:MAG: hypothetical protein IJ115_08065 [Erysipelotrichaceae bacterium]|nr:hypothetical protein [Erysipelotrichaceae bacterium]